VQGFWRVTIQYVNIRVRCTLYRVVHYNTWSNIIVTDDINVKMGCVWNVEYKYYHFTASKII